MRRQDSGGISPIHDIPKYIYHSTGYSREEKKEKERKISKENFRNLWHLFLSLLTCSNALNIYYTTDKKFNG